MQGFCSHSGGCSSFGMMLAKVGRCEPVVLGGSAWSFPDVVGLIPEESLQERHRETIYRNM